MKGIALSLIREAERYVVEGNKHRAIKRLEKALRELRMPVKTGLSSAKNTKPKD